MIAVDSNAAASGAGGDKHSIGIESDKQPVRERSALMKIFLPKLTSPKPKLLIDENFTVSLACKKRGKAVACRLT